MKNSYERKIKGLLWVFLVTPTVILNMSLMWHVARLNLLEIPLVYMLVFFCLEILLFFFLFKRISGFLLEEHQKIEALNFENLDHLGLKTKIEKLAQANDRLYEIYSEIIFHEEASMQNLNQYETEKESALIEIECLNRSVSLQAKVDDALIELTSQFVIQINKEGIIIKINKAFLMRLGYMEHELVGKQFADLLDIEDLPKGTSSLDILRKSLDEPVFISMRMKATNPNAKEYISLKSTALSNEHILCIGKAINDEISLQSNILRKNRELEYINQINSALISNWDIEALLDNIIRRIDHLFNIKLGGIYILNDAKEWDLKSFSSKHMTKEELDQMALMQYFTQDLIKNANIKSLEIYTPEHNNLILSPLQVENEVIAIMCILLNNEMNSNDLNILKMFKNQASMVIQRAIIYDQLRMQYFGTVEALVNVIEAKDKYTEGHSRRVSRFAVEIAKEMGYSNEEIENIEIAGLLHDVGKIGIDQSILGKRGKLTEEEYHIIKDHPSKGTQILQAIAFDERIKDAIKYHHLRYDLKGYPNSTIEKQPLYACIIEIADAFDAITSARSYSFAKSKEDALIELIKHSGTQFAPDMVTVFTSIIQSHPQKIQDIIDDIEVMHLNKS